MLVNGRFQSPERTGRDTIYLRLMMNDAVAAATCGVRAPPRGTAIGTTPPHSLDDAAAAAAVLKYLVIHAMACHLSFVSSALCMISIEIHLGFALAGLLFSLYFRRADSSPMNRGDAAVPTWTFRADESWRRAAAPPRSPRE